MDCSQNTDAKRELWCSQREEFANALFDFLQMNRTLKFIEDANRLFSKLFNQQVLICFIRSRKQLTLYP